VTDCPSTHTPGILPTARPYRCELPEGHRGPHGRLLPLGGWYPWRDTTEVKA
jgi:hypothetical protein